MPSEGVVWICNYVFFFIFFSHMPGGYHRDKKDVEHFIKQNTQTFCRGKILHDMVPSRYTRIFVPALHILQN